MGHKQVSETMIEEFCRCGPKSLVPVSYFQKRGSSLTQDIYLTLQIEINEK